MDRVFFVFLALSCLAWGATGHAQGVDFTETFNDANRAAVDQARVTHLNSLHGEAGEPAPWPEIGDPDRHEFTLAQLKAMAMSDVRRARAMLEGRVITVRGQAGRPNRWGTWLYLKDPEVKYSAKGEWATAINPPSEGAPMGLRGRVSKLQASTIHLEEPQLLR